MKRTKRPPTVGAPEVPPVFLLQLNGGCRAGFVIEGAKARAVVFNDRPGAEAACVALCDHLVACAPRGHLLDIVDPVLTAHGWECSVEAMAVTTSTWGVA